MILSTILFCLAIGLGQAKQPLEKSKIAKDLQALYDENVYARIWRTALNADPSDGWPQYTQGSHNNTPSNDVQEGTYVTTGASGWTAGFFADVLWQLYRRRTLLQKRPSFDGEPDLEQWLAAADTWTEPLKSNENLTNTHDIGFLSNPFRSALTIANRTEWMPVLGKMSRNLAARFVPKAGVIRSWSQKGSHADSVLVIIDNMMNLALLARESAQNKTLLDIARSHADKTMQHHVRTDGSTFHVCDYSATSGELYLCRTAQGLADNSTWARGQAWCIYGFAEIYSFTHDPAYLETSMKCADYFTRNLPDDGLPFWDFNAPYVPGKTPRDSSAATIAASGLLLLQQQLNGSKQSTVRDQKYADAAVALLKSAVKLALAGEISFATNDLSTLGASTSITTPANTTESKGFEGILMHATGNNNKNAGNGRNFDNEALIYGDFYFVEAGNRILENCS